MSLLLDPRAFNWLLMGIYIAAAIRWAFAGNLPNVLYWIAACLILIAVTWGMKH